MLEHSVEIFLGNTIAAFAKAKDEKLRRTFLTESHQTKKQAGQNTLLVFWSPTCNFIRTRNVRKEHGF